LDEKFGQLYGETRLLREDMRAGFTDLRAEMHAGFSDLRGDMAGMRAEIAAARTEFRSEMTADRAHLAALHRQVMVILAGFMVGLLGLLAALVAQV
jgi:hypothetical protein